MVAKNSFTGDLLHCGVVRYQLTGNGTFKTTLLSASETDNSVLPDITMSSSGARNPTILSNFIEQRIFLRGETTDINETFLISRIILYIRPVASGYPQ